MKSPSGAAYVFNYVFHLNTWIMIVQLCVCVCVHVWFSGIPGVIVAVSLGVKDFKQFYGVTQMTMANTNQTSAM